MKKLKMTWPMLAIVIFAQLIFSCSNDLIEELSEAEDFIAATIYYEDGTGKHAIVYTTDGEKKTFTNGSKTEESKGKAPKPLKVPDHANNPKNVEIIEGDSWTDEEAIIETTPDNTEDNTDNTTETGTMPYSYLFTESAKEEIKRRFQVEYVTGPGFINDFANINGMVSSYMQNPSQDRTIFGESWSLPVGRQKFFQAAVYAWANDDQDMANKIAREILAVVEVNDLSDPFWTSGVNWSNKNDLWIQSATVKKTKDSYYLVLALQNTLSDSEKDEIEKWFSDYKDNALNWFESRVNTYLGADWETQGISRFWNEGLMPLATNGSTPHPVEDSSGQPITDYTIAWAQNLFSNRTLDTVAYLYSWAVTHNDSRLENLCRSFFKIIIDYGVFSDGSYWELTRNENSYSNTAGVGYTNVSLSSLVYMAHIDAMSNHYPGDLLYNYTTTNGIYKGSTTYTESPYPGSSTTDGQTLKSLKSVIIGQSKYLRTTENGGWADKRYYDGQSLNTTDKVQNSVVAAIANLYYKDPELEDYYLYNVSKGYPSKKAIYGGYGGFPEDYGAWGTLIAGGIWMEMESYFF